VLPKLPENFSQLFSENLLTFLSRFAYCGATIDG